MIKQEMLNVVHHRMLALTGLGAVDYADLSPF